MAFSLPMIESTSFCILANALIDTGAILALLDRTDRWHDSCVDAFRGLRLPLLTSEAVLAELFRLVGDTRSEMEAAWRFVRSGALVLDTIEDAELLHVHGLMSRYWDRPMDFADGTLVYLAKREFLSVIPLLTMQTLQRTALKESASSGYSRPITRNLKRRRFCPARVLPGPFADDPHENFFDFSSRFPRLYSIRVE
jgi:predicted nucleic acid-binding protein